MTDGRHAWSEELSLELHRRVVERLREDPSVLERARRRVEAWIRDGTMARAYAEAWRDLLARPAEEVVAVLEDPGERARQLRQASPFAGVLDPRTRWAIWREARRGARAS